MKKNMLLVVLIIIGIISISIGIVYFFKDNKESKEKSENDISIEEYFHKKIYPTNNYLLTLNYKGRIEREIFYEQIYKFVSYIPILFETTLDSNVEKYFNKNIEKIIEYTGNSSQNDFETLTKNLSIFTSKDDIIYKEVIINDTDIINDNGYTKLKLDINYEKNVLRFDVYLYNYIQDKDIIMKFVPIS